MASTDNRSLRTLTADQIESLAKAIQDDHGRGLTETQFNDVMLALLEDAAGFEVMSKKRLGRMLQNDVEAVQTAVIFIPRRDGRIHPYPQEVRPMTDVNSPGTHEERLKEHPLPTGVCIPLTHYYPGRSHD